MIPVKNKSIFLFGYYGRGNLGDDIMLDNILEILSKKQTGKITILSTDDLIIDNPKIEIIRGIKNNIFTLFIRLIKCDLFIWGGGTCFFENPSNRGLTELNVFLKIRNIFNKRENFFIGVGMEKLKKRKRIIGKILNNTKAIIFRDLISQNNFLNSFGDKYKSVENIVFDDIVFYNNDKSEKFVKTNDSLNVDTAESYMTFSGYLNLGESHAEHAAEQIIKFHNLNEKLNKVVFLPAKFIKPSDHVFHDLIIKFLTQKGFKAFEKKDVSSTDTFLETIKNSSLHIGMRLHSIILADLNNVPNVAIAYQEKVKQYTNDSIDLFDVWSIDNVRIPNKKYISERISKNTKNYNAVFV